MENFAAMKFKILAFGIARDIMSGSMVDIETSNISTAGELKSFLEEKSPQLKALKSFMIAVNEEYAGDSVKIHSADEIAIIPPVSGG